MNRAVMRDELRQMSGIRRLAQSRLIFLLMFAALVFSPSIGMPLTALAANGHIWRAQDGHAALLSPTAYWAFSGTVRDTQGQTPADISRLRVLLYDGDASGPANLLLGTLVREDGTFQISTSAESTYYYLRIGLTGSGYYAHGAWPGPGGEAYRLDVVRYVEVTPGATFEGIVFLVDTVAPTATATTTPIATGTQTSTPSATGTALPRSILRWMPLILRW